MAAAWCLHAHVILRIPSNEVCGSPESGGPAQHIAKRAVSVTVDDSLHWGTENDCREIKGGKDTNSVIGYLKKAVSYVTKDVCEERPEGRSRNAKHIIMLEYAARCMHCDKCERIREGAKERIAETEMNLGKLRSDAEAVPVGRHAEEIRRYLRIAMRDCCNVTVCRIGDGVQGLASCPLQGRPRNMRAGPSKD